MTFKVLLFVTRKPTITPAEFKTRCDAHAAMIKSIAGSSFPVTHTRRYVTRTEDNESYPAAVLIGTQEDFTYDAIAELVFEDKGAFETFIGVVSAPEAAARIAEDEDGFIVREKLRGVAIGGGRCYGEGVRGGGV